MTKPSKPPGPQARPLSGEAQPPYVLTVNQVVAHNLARARRATGWTQADAAARLEQATGRSWSAATLGAAERSVETGRTREFDANELLAFSVVFGQPISYFFIPPDIGDRESMFAMDRRATAATALNENSAARLISEFELLDRTLPLRFPGQVVDDVNRVLAKKRQVWYPGRSKIGWRHEEEAEGWAEVAAPTALGDAQQTAAAAAARAEAIAAERAMREAEVAEVVAIARARAEEARLAVHRASAARDAAREAQQAAAESGHSFQVAQDYLARAQDALRAVQEIEHALHREQREE